MFLIKHNECKALMYVACTPISVKGSVMGLFPLLNGIFLMITKKLTPFGKFLVTVVGSAHTEPFGQVCCVGLTLCFLKHQISYQVQVFCNVHTMGHKIQP